MLSPDVNVWLTNIRYSLRYKRLQESSPVCLFCLLVSKGTFHRVRISLVTDRNLSTFLHILWYLYHLLYETYISATTMSCNIAELTLHRLLFRCIHYNSIQLIIPFVLLFHSLFNAMSRDYSSPHIVSEFKIQLRSNHGVASCWLTQYFVLTVFFHKLGSLTSTEQSLVILPMYRGD